MYKCRGKNCTAMIQKPGVCLVCKMKKGAKAAKTPTNKNNGPNGDYIIGCIK